jgi:hypothetical protein
MRKFTWVLLISVGSVLLIYAAGVWFESLIPE